MLAARVVEITFQIFSGWTGLGEPAGVDAAARLRITLAAGAAVGTGTTLHTTVEGDVAPRGAAAAVNVLVTLRARSREDVADQAEWCAVGVAGTTPEGAGLGRRIGGDIGEPACVGWNDTAFTARVERFVEAELAVACAPQKRGDGHHRTAECGALHAIQRWLSASTTEVASARANPDGYRDKYSRAAALARALSTLRSARILSTVAFSESGPFG